MDEQIKELTKMVMDLRLDLARMDTKMDSFKDMQHKLEVHESRITSAEASTKSAHIRLDEIKSNMTWMWRSIGLTIGGGILTAILTFIIKGGLVK